MPSHTTPSHTTHHPNTKGKRKNAILRERERERERDLVY